MLCFENYQVQALSSRLPFMSAVEHHGPRCHSKLMLSQSRLHAWMHMHIFTLSFLYIRLPLRMYLYIQLEQCHEAIHQHKRCTLFISTLDAHISC